MLKIIIHELKSHSSFTIFGALFGVVLMAAFQRIPENIAYNTFYVLHPLHVFLSALTTASMYHRHKCEKLKKKCNIWMLLLIGYIGSVGIATLSDSVIPYLGETLLNMPHREMHVGFIEKWWLINPLAIAGIAIAYFKPTTKFPHGAHVLISTWASLFHVIMAMGNPLGVGAYIGIFLFLFLAVWVPCCVSDIVFPLLFVKDDERVKCSC
ncbi:MAG: hypothetical protein PHY73_05590 [Candidatus Omnitrophica bacterium]|nr:hypothetical protein [Candidatus Omnitrophota bacterium]